MGELVWLTVARVGRLALWLHWVGIGLLVWASGGALVVHRSLSEVLNHVSGARESQWPLSLCVWMEEFTGNLWAGCVAGNGWVRLEEPPAH